MKKVVFSSLVVAAILFFGCKNDGNDEDPQVFTVTFESNGGSFVPPQTVKEGDKVDEPSEPLQSGFTFLGWYKDAEWTSQWDFDIDVVTDNLTLYAKWDENEVNALFLVNAEPIAVIPKTLLSSVASSYLDNLDAALFKSNVRVVKVIYKTEYPEGTILHVSGIACISEDLNPNFPTLVYLHGTVEKGGAPSDKMEGFAEGAVISSVTNGVVLMPDYIGYGESENVLHPYCHGPSLAQTSFDMIRAYKEYATDNFNSNIFITGYSEGGYAAVALQKKIQEIVGSGLNVHKTVAGSGPYDFVSFGEQFLSKDEKLDPKELGSYLWAIGMFKIDYGYSKPFEDIFSAEDNAKLKAINYDLGYFNPVNKTDINLNPQNLLKQSFISGAKNGTDTEFMNILKANSLVDFFPADSLIFVYGNADTWVYPVNTENAYNAMKQEGCPVKSYMLPGGNHNTTVNLYLDVLLLRLMMEDKK